MFTVHCSLLVSARSLFSVQCLAFKVFNIPGMCSHVRCVQCTVIYWERVLIVGNAWRSDPHCCTDCTSRDVP
jgi:NAD-dependent SIR2 family protein deacetylase